MKLIEVDALMEPLDQWSQEMRETWQSNVRMSFFLTGLVQKVEELTVSLPDASETLQERIAELEAEVEMMRPWFEAAQKAMDSPGVPFQRQMEDDPNA